MTAVTTSSPESSTAGSPRSRVFSEEHEAFRETVRRFVAREIAPHVEAWEQAGIFPAHELFPKLGALGLLGLEYDLDIGGQGADHLFSLILGEETGRIDCGGVPMGIAVQTSMATPALHRFGNPELKERFLRPAIQGDMVASIAVTEPDAGSDVAGLRTRARRDGSDWVINGSKLYITNAVQADWLCLLARTSDEGGYRGMSQIIVPTSTPGVVVSRKLEKLGMWSSDTAELAFQDARVPMENTIGEIGRGFQQQMAQFESERMMACYQTIGSMSHALERTAGYLKKRGAFGKKLIDHQYVAFRLAEASAKLDLFHQYCYTVALEYADGQSISRKSAIAKLTSGRLLREISDLCIQFHGGLGYMQETWTSRYYRDARLQSIGGGADEVMLRVIAKLDGFES